MEIDLILKKSSDRRLNADTGLEHLQYIAKAADNFNQFHCVAPKTFPEPAIDGDKYNYVATLKLLRKDDTQGNYYLGQALERLRKRSDLHKWQIDKSTLPENAAHVMSEEIKQNLQFELPKLDEDSIGTYFSDIYDREAHIRCIHAAATTSSVTEFKKRRHVLLHGKPACAKTEILLALQKFYGEDKVLSLDATTLTKAGLEQLILEKASDGLLPPFLILEEIEKNVQSESLSCLLSIMDHRGTISRTNARIGSITRQAKIVVWATCNNIVKLRNVLDGAILSRFNYKLHCQRPNRELMAKILLRELREMGGDEAWIKPVVDFAYDVMRTDDPREVISLLDGRERILDGSFFHDINMTREIECTP